MGFKSSRVNVILVIVAVVTVLLAGCNRSATKPEPTTEPAVEEELQDTPVQIMATPTSQAQPAEPTDAATEEAAPSVEPAEPTQQAAPSVEPAQPTAAPTQDAAPVEATEPAAEQTYVVMVGDTLFGIAQYFGVSVEELAARNGILDANVLEVGQQLVIPVGGAVLPEAPVPGEETYIVQPGDNLFRIALRYELSFETVAAYNNIPWPYAVYVGQEIKIPTVP